MALLLLPLLTLTAVAVGRRILRLLRLSPTAGLEDGVLSIGLGYGAIAYLTLGLGLAGGLHRAAIAAMLLLLAGLSWQEIARPRPGGASALPPATHGGSGWHRLAAILLTVMAAAALLGALAPVTAGDALMYHLGAPKLWLQAHRIYPLPWLWVTYQPLHVEMLYLLAMALQGETLASLINWAFGLWTAAALFVLVRRHFPRLDPWLVVGIFYVSPLVLDQSVSTLVELGWTFFTVGAVHCVLSYAAAGEERWLLVGGLFAGLAAATKYPGILVPVLLILPVLATARPPGRRWRAFLLFSTPVALLAIPWYLRTWIWTGDPTYPFLTAWLGDERLLAHLDAISGRYGFGKGPIDLLAAPFRLILLGHRFGGGAQLGPLYLSLLPLALGAAPRERGTLVLGFLLIGYGLLWFYSSQEARFLLPVLPLAAVLCGGAWVRGGAWGPGLRRLMAGVVVLWLSLTTALAIGFAAVMLPVAGGWESRDRYLHRTVPSYRVLQWMNRTLPPDAALFVAGRRAYHLDRPFVGGIRLLSRAELLSLVDRHGVIYIYCVGPECPRLRAKLPEAITVHESRQYRRVESADPARSDFSAAVLRVGGP